MTLTDAHAGAAPGVRVRPPAVRLERWRWPVALSLFVAADAHYPLIGEHLAEAPYMGVAFLAFTVTCAVLAVVIVLRPARPAYGFALLLCVAALLTYGATRLVEFPQLGHDVGHWAEPLGLVSVTAEAFVVLTAYLARRR